VSRVAQPFLQVLDRSKSRRERLRLEVEIQRKIGRHPQIVELLDVYETPVHVVMVFELMAGELFDRIVSVGPYAEHGESLFC
jgi:serine/threonine protein kinase